MTVWIPATPEPFHAWRKLRCECGQKFKRADRDAYEKHWHSAHALETYARSGPKAQMEVSYERALALGYYPSDQPRTQTT